MSGPSLEKVQKKFKPNSGVQKKFTKSSKKSSKTVQKIKPNSGVQKKFKRAISELFSELFSRRRTLTELFPNFIFLATWNLNCVKTLALNFFRTLDIYFNMKTISAPSANYNAWPTCVGSTFPIEIRIARAFGTATF